MATEQNPSKSKPEFPSGALSYNAYAPIQTDEDLRRQDEQRKFRTQFMSAVDSSLQRRVDDNIREESPVYTAQHAAPGLGYSPKANHRDFATTSTKGGSVGGAKASSKTPAAAGSLGGGFREGEEQEEPRRRPYSLRARSHEGLSEKKGDSSASDSDDDENYDAGGRLRFRAISITGEVLTNFGSKASVRSGGNRLGGSYSSSQTFGAARPPALGGSGSVRSSGYGRPNSRASSATVSRSSLRSPSPGKGASSRDLRGSRTTVRS